MFFSEIGEGLSLASIYWAATVFTENDSLGICDVHLQGMNLLPEFYSIYFVLYFSQEEQARHLARLVLNTHVYFLC